VEIVLGEANSKQGSDNADVQRLLCPCA
jgi:hypothetical protein